MKAVALALALLALPVIAGCSRNEVMELGSADLLLAAQPKGLAISGLEGPETSPEGSWRWAVGPSARLSFHSSRPREYVLRYAMNNPLPGQRIELLVNGESRAVHDGLKPDPWLRPSVRQVLRFTARPGVNTLEWTFSLRNHAGAVFAESDRRPLSQAILEMRLYPAVSP